MKGRVLSMRSVGELSAIGRKMLSGRTEYPARDASVLLGHVLGKGSDYVYLHPEEPVDEEHEREYLALLSRRQAGEPLAYLRGYQEFMGFRFKVDRNVLIPRPETEVLVETVLKVRGDVRGIFVADVCCGSGNIGISLARLLPHVFVVGLDVSAGALEVARENAESLGVADRMVFLEGDLLEPLEKLQLEGEFDAITSNPPYIPEETLHLLPVEVREFEPLEALDGGPGGLHFIQRLVFEASRFLKPHGRLFMEIGFDQSQIVREFFREAEGRYARVETVRDYAGRERLFVAERCLKDAKGRDCRGNQTDSN